MADSFSVKLRITGLLLALDAAVLFLLGTLLLVLPRPVLFAVGIVYLLRGIVSFRQTVAAIRRYPGFVRLADVTLHKGENYGRE